MASGLGESIPPPSPPCSGGNNANDAGDFECNICFELAQDPIVTLCGHLLVGNAYTDGCTIILFLENAEPSSRAKPAIAPPPPPETNQFTNYWFGLMGGFVPMATTRIGYFTMGFGGLLSSLFNIQFPGFPYATVYGTTSGFPFGFNTVQGGHTQGFPQQPTTRGHEADNVLKNLLLFMVLAPLYW